MALTPVFVEAKKKKKNKKTAVTEQTQAQSEAKDEKTETKITFATISDAEKQLSGEWTIKTMRNKSVRTDTRAYLNFDIKNSKLYGSNGCNTINADLDFSPTEGKLSILSMIASNNSCSAGGHRNVMKALTEVAALQLKTEKGIEYLYLQNVRGHELIKLKRQNFDFINGVWTVTSIDDKPMAANHIRLVIDTDQMTLHGNTSCNIINGQITIDSDKDHAIQFDDINSSNHKCADIDTETALLVALEEVVSARQVSQSDISLVDNKNKVIVTLHKLYIKH